MEMSLNHWQSRADYRLHRLFRPQKDLPVLSTATQPETCRSSKAGCEHSNLDNRHEVHFHQGHDQINKVSFHHLAGNLKDRSCKFRGTSQLKSLQVLFALYRLDGCEGGNGGKARKFRKGKSALSLTMFAGLCVEIFHLRHLAGF